MKNRSGLLYCFTPPVMLATFIFETTLFVYTIVRYKMNPLTRVVALTLLFLALFQLSEYKVCGGFGVTAATWSRVGFVAITMLPVLGIHLLQRVSGRGSKLLLWLAYATAAVWAVLFAFSERAFRGHICAGNYVIFQLKPSLDWPYFIYYYGWLMLGIGMCIYFAKNAKKYIREALLLQVFGYLVFLLPTAILNGLNPATVEAIPSIMCGFAVLYALILVFGIIPSILKPVVDRTKKS